MKPKKKIRKLERKVAFLERENAGLRHVIDANNMALRSAYEANIAKNKQIRKLQEELRLFL